MQDRHKDDKTIEGDIVRSEGWMHNNYNYMSEHRKQVYTLA